MSEITMLSTDVMLKINEMLKARHESPAWFLGLECQLDQSRADAIAVRMGFTPGWTVGYEVKITRADFLRELQNPAKRLELYERCNEVFFVAPKGVFEISELPEGWGWLQFTPTGLLQKHAAAQRQKDVKDASMFLLRHLNLRMAQEKPLPKKLFKYMGQELTEAELLEIASAKVGELQRQIRSEIEPKLIEEIRTRERLALDKTTSEAIGLYHFIQRHMEWRNASPEAVARVLEPLFEYRKLGLELAKTSKALACLQDAVRLNQEVTVSVSN